MRTRMFSSLGSVLILAGFAFALPALATGSGTTSAPGNVGKPDAAAKKESPAPQPRQDQAKKVYTNDDFGWYHPSAAASQSDQASAPAAQEDQSDLESTPPAEQQDPQWYARQVISLQDDLAAIQSKEDALQQFRDTSSGLPTGLNLIAPTEAITTDGLIEQLESRRRQIEQDLDDLADLARVNGLPSDTVNQPSVPAAAPATLADQQDALTKEYSDVADQLADTQAALDAMQQQAAAQNITLISFVPGNGGNLTTNRLDNLNSQADALQSALSDVEDNARTLGVQPGDLR